MPIRNKEVRTAIVIFIIPFIVNVSAAILFCNCQGCVCVMSAQNMHKTDWTVSINASLNTRV